MAERSQNENQRHLHVFWSHSWYDGNVGGSSQQKSSSHGNDDEEFLDGMTYDVAQI